jgi:hypothetical protein
MTREDLDTMRDVLLTVSTALITSTRADPANVSTALRLFAQSHVEGSESNRALGDTRNEIIVRG